MAPSPVSLLPKPLFPSLDPKLHIAIHKIQNPYIPLSLPITSSRNLPSRTSSRFPNLWLSSSSTSSSLPPLPPLSPFSPLSPLSPLPPLPPLPLSPLSPLSLLSPLSPLSRTPRPRHVAAAANGSRASSSSSSSTWQEKLDFAAGLYPVYVTVGSLVAMWSPGVFSWFVARGPTSYSVALGLIMLAMGLTLEREALVEVIWRRPGAVLFGCAAQYGIMPIMGLLMAKVFHLSSDLTAGLILLAACPGGTASNVVTYIAYGDVPLSVVMTLCATLSAVALTPALTQALAGAYVPVDAVGLGISTLQVVVLPVLLGTWLQTRFPKTVSHFVPFCPLAAVLTSSLLCCSVFSANFPILFSAISGSKKVFDAALLVQVLGSVLSLHTAGFFLGYTVSRLAGYEEPQRRAVSIEVGMQNSSLGVVLACAHFSSPLSSLPASLSAVAMNVMGSSLAAIWRSQGPLKMSTSASQNPSPDATSAFKSPLQDATSASKTRPVNPATSASGNSLEDASSAAKNPTQAATSASTSASKNRLVMVATSDSGNPLEGATSASESGHVKIATSVSDPLEDAMSASENLLGNATSARERRPEDATSVNSMSST